MTKFEDNESPYLTAVEQASAVAAPGTGLWRAFFKSDGLYVIDDAGTVTGPLAVSGGGGGSAVGPWTVFAFRYPTRTFTSAVGTWTFFRDAQHDLGGIVYNSTAAQNDEINIDLPISAGTWSIDLIHLKDNTRGIATFSIDNGAGSFTTAGTLDLYGSSTVFNNQQTLSGVTVTGTAVNRRLKVKVASKNASSTGYILALQSIILRRTA